MGDGTSKLTSAFFRSTVKKLLMLSASRGKDASGLALFTSENIYIVKRDLAADRFLKTPDYQELMKIVQDTAPTGKHIDSPLALIGHSRMVTNGTEEIAANNQPIVKNGIVVIHNGIIVNRDLIMKEFPFFHWETDSDTEIIPTLLDYFLKESKEQDSEVHALRQLYQKIEGVASTAILSANSDHLFLATNNGSLYIAFSLAEHVLLFASEKYILQALFRQYPRFATYTIHHIEAGNAVAVTISDFSVQPFSLTCHADIGSVLLLPDNKARQIIDLSQGKKKNKTSFTFHIPTFSDLELSWAGYSSDIDRLKRCSCCLLPETFPFITFDEQGICTVCKNYKKLEYKGAVALEQLLTPHKKTNGEPDIIIPLSGGRDSTYALHYVKTVLGMNPVAYTYDWGMVTDLARRNISRITAKLGVEHILISADIKKKRGFIKSNVNAWLKRPRLGTLPLFMAGDKQFFYYGNMLQKQMHIDLILYGMNPLERTDFKVAFTGIEEKKKQDRHYSLSLLHKLHIFLYYGKEYLANPAYLNRSLVDTLSAYISYYFIPHDYFIFYEYIPWDEDLINHTIIDNYQWETSPDTPTTWRIGDGTASFYNYIYLTVAGFSENDTFRSNQIRQGIISREKALEIVKKENSPRFESIKWYCDTNGLDFKQTIKLINEIPKLY